MITESERIMRDMSRFVEAKELSKRRMICAMLNRGGYRYEIEEYPPELLNEYGHPAHCNCEVCFARIVGLNEPVTFAIEDWQSNMLSAITGSR